MLCTYNLWPHDVHTWFDLFAADFAGYIETPTNAIIIMQPAILFKRTPTRMRSPQPRLQKPYLLEGEKEIEEVRKNCSSHHYISQ